MDKEAAILRQFLNGQLPYANAIAQLELVGYSADEAKQMVDEWADAAEDDNQD
jgi:hypothetical protein